MLGTAVLGTAVLGTAVLDDVSTVAAAADAIFSTGTEVGCVDDAEDDVSDDDVSEDCCDSSVFSTGTVEFCSADVDAGNDATDSVTDADAGNDATDSVADVDAGNDATDSVTDVDAGNDAAFAIDDTDASCCAVVAVATSTGTVAVMASDDGEAFDTADDCCDNGITRSDPGTVRGAAVFDDVCDNREADDGTPGTDSGTVSEAADVS